MREDWLDKKPPGSVLYVSSFGSNSSVSDDQISQIAIVPLARILKEE